MSKPEHLSIASPHSPLPQSNGEPSASVAHHAESGGWRPLQILLVEDSEINQKVVVGLLVHEGHSVAVAENGKDALNKLIPFTSGMFDLVLMDVQMPIMDGYETTAAIRNQERATGSKQIPVIAMTANTSISDREKCLDAGMNDYIAKPVRAKELRDILTKWAGPLTGAKMMSGKSPDEVIPNTEFADSAPIDLNAALDNLEGNQRILQKVLRCFLDNAPTLLNEMKQAAATGDAARLKVSAHSLKGAASNVCANPTRRAAEAIENMASANQLDHVDKALIELDYQLARLPHALNGDPTQ